MLWQCHAATPGWLGLFRAAVPATRVVYRVSGIHGDPLGCAAGIVTTEATLVLADCSAARSIIRFQDEVDKVKQIDSHKVRGPTHPLEPVSLQASPARQRLGV